MRGVAELALTLALAGLRDVVPTHEGHEAWRPPRRSRDGWRPHRCRGLGAIGASFAQFCLALGATAVVMTLCGPGPRDGPEFRPAPIWPVRKLTGAYVVSLHAPMPADGAAGSGGISLRVSRPGGSGQYGAGGRGRCRCAAGRAGSGQVGTMPPMCLRPSPRPRRCFAHPRVILTSHIMASPAESVERATTHAVANLLLALAVHVD